MVPLCLKEEAKMNELNEQAQCHFCGTPLGEGFVYPLLCICDECLDKWKPDERWQEYQVKTAATEVCLGGAEAPLINLYAEAQNE